MKTELEERNIDNTHPAELKRIQRKEIDDNIIIHKRRIEFTMVSATFFLLVGAIILLNPNVINSYFAIIPSVISLIFIAATFIFREHLKTEKIARRMLELFYKHYNL